MCSKPGDIVLDPFCGGGTTLAVADKLGRQWIGIDQSVAAVKVSELRLHKHQDLLSVPFSVQLHKYDYDRLRAMDAILFQDWIIEQYGGRSNPVKGGELGVDGWMPDGTIIQVKRSDKVDRIEIDKFFSAVQRKDKNLYKKNKTEKKPVGYFIAFSFGKGAIEEVARLKMKEGIIIKLLTVEDIVPLAKKPKIKTVFKVLSTNAFGQREIELTATGESDAGIEFYSWDFSFNEKDGFKADVVCDPDGKQIRNLGVGTHHIAVKVIDNEGLESIEVVPLHINGGVKRKKQQ
jgi:site-specific DNA-methyltransferase (adenine-specific)